MEKENNPKELVTKEYLHLELSAFRKEFNTFWAQTNDKLTQHDKIFEKFFYKFREHDERFDQMDAKLDKTIDIIQGLADKVAKDYQTFIVESSSIHFNYKNLEERTTKLEHAVFPKPEHSF